MNFGANHDKFSGLINQEVPNNLLEDIGENHNISATYQFPKPVISFQQIIINLAIHSYWTI
jgi:hypothetical protein